MAGYFPEGHVIKVEREIIMTRILLLMTLNLFSLLAGCAALDAYNLARTTVFDPTDIDIKVEEHQEHYKRQSNNNGSMYIVWYATFAKVKQSMSGIYIYVNGKRVSAVKHNTYTVLDLSPGRYKISVGDKSNHEEPITIQINAGDDLYYSTGIRINILMPDSLFLIKNEDTKYAKNTISKCTYVTPQQS